VIESNSNWRRRRDIDRAAHRRVIDDLWRVPAARAD
jgi:hypothetical protein